MNDDTLEVRPWRRRRWWFAVIAVVLVVAYPASVGPAMYAQWRGWVSREVYQACYAPVIAAAGHEGRGNLLRSYHGWWEQLCLRLDIEDSHERFKQLREARRPSYRRVDLTGPSKRGGADAL